MTVQRFNHISVTKYNKVVVVEAVDKKYIRVSTQEVAHDPLFYSRIIYTFNKNFEVVAILAVDGFIKIHNKLEKEGKLKQTYNQAYLKSLKDSIKYWDGEKFVNTPTMNKKYNSAKQVVDLAH
ncbi:MAG: hypothetical protein HY800_05885 [Ignavibacteriales bacterium]|nr:hypothetical protein [Ignavibacteriales bacterium]